MKTVGILLFCSIVFGISPGPLAKASADEASRRYPENELHAQPAIKISVGHNDADLIGTDNRALQAAVDYVGNLGGGIVEIGPGEYLMRDSLHLRSRVTVRGSGETTILKKDAEFRSPLAADGDFGEAAISVVNPQGFGVGRGVYVASQQLRYLWNGTPEAGQKLVFTQVYFPHRPYRPKQSSNNPNPNLKAAYEDDLQATAHASGIKVVRDDVEASVLRLELTPDHVEWVVFNQEETPIKLAKTETSERMHYEPAASKSPIKKD